jgi:dUTP pyrophosphatase
MKITFQKTMNVPDPVRAHDTDAGLDLYVPEGQGCLVRPGAVYTIDLGCRVAIPDGYYGQLTLRSSAGRKGLTTPHGVGIIDSGYRGNLKVLVAALAEPTLVAANERICQLVILPLPPVDVETGVVDDNTSRGEGGFGSTGGDLEAAARAPEIAAVTKHLLPCEKEIVECLVRSARKSGEDAEEDFREAARHARRIAYDEDGAYDPGTVDVAVGHIIGVIAARTPRGSALWRDTFNAAVRLSDEWGEEEDHEVPQEQKESRGAGMNRKERKTDGRAHLTVGGLMRELQEIAFRHGNDTPVVLPTKADADYEQGAAPAVMHARREPVPDDWDLFHIDPTGEAVMVIS